MVEIKNLRVEYRSGFLGLAKTVVVDGLDLVVRPGVVSLLIGVNGAGKTTLLRTLAGLQQPASGSVSILGRDHAKDPASTRGLVGFCTETLSMPPQWTVLEAVAFLASERAASLSQAEDLARAALARARADDLEGSPVGTLSKGQQVKASLASALLFDPPILLLDEPTAGLDLHSSLAMRTLFRDLAASGRTLLYSSHQAIDALSLADEIHGIASGRRMTDQELDDYLEPARQEFAEIAKIAARHAASGSLRPKP